MEKCCNYQSAYGFRYPSVYFHTMRFKNIFSEYIITLCKKKFPEYLIQAEKEILITEFDSAENLKAHKISAHLEQK
jgi:hypothetical protein